MSSVTWFRGQLVVAEAVSSGRQVFLAVLIVLALLAVSTTIWAMRRRKQSWRTFARRVNGTYQEVDGRPSVRGTYRGRRFTLTISPDSSDTGLLGVEVTVMRVEYAPPSAGSWQLESQAAAVTAIDTASGEPTVTTLDEDFDAHTAVRATAPDQVLEFLDERRRRLILNLIENNPQCRIRVTPTEIQAIDRTINQPPRTLEKRLHALVVAARGLEEG